jgi:hypothetical protein
MRVPSGAAALTSGELVDVRWDPLPADVEELELLLVVDETATASVRLSPQLAGTTSSFQWRVPNLPGENARLRLRYGRGGREVEAEPSLPFAIHLRVGQPLEAVTFHRGEWWLTREAGVSWLPPLQVGGELREPHDRKPAGPAPVLPRSPLGALWVSCPLARAADCGSDRDGARGALVPAGRCPRDTPLRP